MTITSCPISQSRIVSYFTSNHPFTFNIRHGFVECLEEDESSEVVNYIMYILSEVCSKILNGWGKGFKFLSEKIS